ncbi:MAG: Hsp70 family protein [Candidatus Dormibacteraeota bacterium]|nr:Hsp70 family protein [Candidatus Dormibacteraeota bacterium]
MATYGIDLGTTYSCIAYLDESSRPVILKSEVGEDLTPSVVYFETPDKVEVGRAAKNTALLLPDLVVSLIKRQMGQDFSRTFHGHVETPESISALILKELVRAAQAQTSETIKDVVITVPAYFGRREREATLNAGKIAGLNVLNLVQEPVAAALHYDALSGGGDRTILVYDLGGGTFDTTVIQLANNEVHVLCTDGNHHRGGADWDGRIVDYLVEQFQAEHPDKDPSGNEEFLQSLANDAEQLKKDLSSVQSRKPIVRFDGAAVRVELTREKLEELTSDLLEETMNTTRRTIETARERGVESFDDVLLVGGASRMPAVTRELRARFGFEPRLHDPDLAVAKGAALFAVIAALKIRLPDGKAADTDLRDAAAELGISPDKLRRLAETKVTAVLPRAFGVRLQDEYDSNRFYIDHLVFANDPLPKSSDKQYRTVADNQTAVEIKIYEQVGEVASPEVEHNDMIGEGLISGLPPLPKHSPIAVSFDVDEMGNLKVHAVELSTRKDVHIELRIRGLDQSQVAEAASHVAAAQTSG